MSKVLIVVELFIMTIAGTFGAYCLKKTTARMEHISIIGLIKAPWLYCGCFCYVLGAVLNMILLRVLDYSIVYPLTSLTYLWTAIFSALVLKERIGNVKLMALFCIIAGAFLLNL